MYIRKWKRFTQPIFNGWENEIFWVWKEKIINANENAIVIINKINIWLKNYGWYRKILWVKETENIWVYM